MANRVTVFYSWQSDTPAKLNRNFIEKALGEALKRLHSDATLELALRDSNLELDKDTQGVAGSPPIADTILKKVEDCAVFVGDLMFVGETLKALTRPSCKPRLFPNPNVLIEYGYALKCHSHAALVGVMNTAYGKPDAESLPFDLRHLRWPITYHLADASAVGADSEFDNLVSRLVDALRLILVERTTPKLPDAPFGPHKTTTNAALFFDDPADLVPQDQFGDKPVDLILPNEGVAYLRLFPAFAVPPIDTELEAQEIAVRAVLRPLGNVRGFSVVRNAFGAIVFEPQLKNALYHLTQVFLSRELWGVDAASVNATYLRDRTPGKSNPYIPSSFVENNFVETLQNYLLFAHDYLKLPLPLHVEAGLFGIKGYAIAVTSQTVRGRALHDHIAAECDVNSYQTPAYEILAPFFNRMWAKCGVERPASQQAELAKRFNERQ